MFDYIAVSDVETILDDLLVIKHIDKEESLLSLSYKKGYREALEQVKLELRQPDVMARMLKLRSVNKEEK